METRLVQDIRSLDTAASCLEGPIERSGSKVRGFRRGWEVEFSIPTMGGGWNVRAKAPPIPFSLDVFESAAYLESRQKVGVGDAEFDAQYSVEGAPVSVVARLLDEDTRELILRLRPRRIRGRTGEIHIEEKHAYHDAQPERIAPAIDLAASLAARVAAEVAADEDALLREAAARGTPYRGNGDASAVEATREDRDKRVRALARRQDRRISRRSARALIAALVGAAILLGLALLDVLF